MFSVECEALTRASCFCEQDWDSELSLYRAGLDAAPGNAKLHHNAAYYMSGKVCKGGEVGWCMSADKQADTDTDTGRHTHRHRHTHTRTSWITAGARAPLS